MMKHETFPKWRTHACSQTKTDTAQEAESVIMRRTGRSLSTSPYNVRVYSYCNTVQRNQHHDEPWERDERLRFLQQGRGGGPLQGAAVRRGATNVS